MEDLRTSDLYSFNELEAIRKMEAIYLEAKDQTFTMTPRNGIMCELVEDGANVAVTVENKD
jgi:hypothetical protein